MNSGMTRVGLLCVFLGLVMEDPAHAQSVVHRLDGTVNGERLGTAVAGIDDLDQDGIPDFLIGTALGRVDLVSGADGSVIQPFFGASFGDDFGHALAAIGDLDFDGFSDFVVGAPQIANSGTGYVAVHSGATGALLYSLAGGFAGDAFGFAVSAVGDIDLDGAADFAVGSPYADVPGIDSGRAQVFSGLNGVQILAWSGAQGSDNLGFSVAGAGDVDSDGFPDTIVGAPGGHQGPSGFFAGTGEARIFSGSNGSTLRVLQGDDADDQFGWSVAGGLDLDLDGIDDQAVGAPADDDLVVNGGGLRVFSGADGSVMRDLDGSVAQGRFATTLAMVGDFDGDFIPDLAAGAPLSGPGQVIVLTPLTGQILATRSGGSLFASFGSALAPAGDLNGDGRRELITGAPGAPQRGVFRGRFEVHAFAPFLGPAAAGNAGAGGSPIDILLIDGSGGGVSRRVDLAAGASFSLSVMQPPANPLPAAFALFGAQAAPVFEDALSLPAGIGTFAFVPCPLLPSAQPFLFVLTNNFGAGACGELVPSAPTPWSLSVPNGIPFPITITLQGLVESSPGGLAVTNAVLVRAN